MFAAVCLGVVVALFINSAVCDAIEERCSACRSVADAFVRRLDNERVRNHLDMRHRLDKNGKRYGKIIDYKVSELRVSELLDDLCEDMKDFAWAKHNQMAWLGVESGAESWTWVRTKGDGAVELEAHALPPKDEAKIMQTQLKAYCYSLIERTEESLSGYLASGSKHHEGLDEYICEQLVGHCEPSQPPENDDDNSSHTADL